jgi:hypothetical protein
MTITEIITARVEKQRQIERIRDAAAVLRAALRQPDVSPEDRAVGNRRLDDGARAVGRLEVEIAELDRQERRLRASDAAMPPAGAVAPVAPPADPPADPVSDEQRRMASDIARRISAAESRELEKRLKHADLDRERFAAWTREHWGRDGKALRYIRTAVAPLVGDADANAVASEIAGDVRTSLLRGEPRTEAEYWSEHRVEWIEASLLNCLYRREYDRELVAALS